MMSEDIGMPNLSSFGPGGRGRQSRKIGRLQGWCCENPQERNEMKRTCPRLGQANIGPLASQALWARTLQTHHGWFGWVLSSEAVGKGSRLYPDGHQGPQTHSMMNSDEFWWILTNSDEFWWIMCFPKSCSPCSNCLFQAFLCRQPHFLVTGRCQFGRWWSWKTWRPWGGILRPAALEALASAEHHSEHDLASGKWTQYIYIYKLLLIINYIYIYEYINYILIIIIN